MSENTYLPFEITGEKHVIQKFYPETLDFVLEFYRRIKLHPRMYTSRFSYYSVAPGNESSLMRIIDNKTRLFVDHLMNTKTAP